MLFYLLIIFLAVIIQITSIFHFQLLGFSPNLPLVVLIFSLWQSEGSRSYFFSREKTLSIFRDYGRFFILVVFTGLILDLFSVFTFGLNTLSLVLTFLLVYIFLRGFLSRSSLETLLILAVLTTVFYYLSLVACFYLFSWLKINYNYFYPSLGWFRLLAMESLYNTIFVALIFYVHRRLRKIFY